MESKNKILLCNILNSLFFLLKTTFIISLGLGYFGHINIFLLILIILVISEINLKFNYIDDNKNDYYLKVNDKTVFSYIKK